MDLSHDERPGGLISTVGLLTVNREVFRRLVPPISVETAREAELSAWRLAAAYLEDSNRARMELHELAESGKRRVADLYKIIESGTFDPTGDGSETRPYTINEICSLHRCANETEKMVISTFLGTIQQANHDTFTEFVRKVHAATALQMKAENLEDGTVKKVGGARLGAGRPPQLEQSKKKADPSYHVEKAKKESEAVKSAISDAKASIGSGVPQKTRARSTKKIIEEMDKAAAARDAGS